MICFVMMVCRAFELLNAGNVRRYILSTSLSLYNKQLLGKKHGVFGKGAFPGASLRAVFGVRERHYLAYEKQSEHSPLPLLPIHCLLPLKCLPACAAPLFMSSVQFLCQTVLAKGVFMAGVVERTRTRPLPWREYGRVGEAAHGSAHFGDGVPVSPLPCVPSPAADAMHATPMHACAA